MRAIHKYNKNSREGARRIAQSLGYKFTIWDMPHMVALLQRAGIFPAFAPEQDVAFEKPAKTYADTETINL